MIQGHGHIYEDVVLHHAPQNHVRQERYNSTLSQGPDGLYFEYYTRVICYFLIKL